VGAFLIYISKVVVKGSPTFGECPPPMGFTHHKTKGEHYNLTICKPLDVGKAFFIDLSIL
jgi:hypothetical protein